MTDYQQYIDKIYSDYETAVSSGKSGFDSLLTGISDFISHFSSLELFCNCGNEVIAVLLVNGI